MPPLLPQQVGKSLGRLLSAKDLGHNTSSLPVRSLSGSPHNQRKSVSIVVPLHAACFDMRRSGQVSFIHMKYFIHLPTQYQTPLTLCKIQAFIFILPWGHSYELCTLQSTELPHIFPAASLPLHLFWWKFIEKLPQCTGYSAVGWSMVRSSENCLSKTPRFFPSWSYSRTRYIGPGLIPTNFPTPSGCLTHTQSDKE